MARSPSNKSAKESSRNLFIKPGFASASTDQVNFCTVACYGIVVTLHDVKNEVGGICHYLFPHWEEGKPSTPLFAGPAVMSLITMFNHRGSNVKNLHAQIIGGACRPGDVKLIELSDQNIKTAYSLLEKNEINIVNLDVGGFKCRRIVFDTKTGVTQVTEMEQIRTSEWIVMKDSIEKIA